MSQLPKGTSATVSFLKSVILSGIEAKAAALLPGLAAVPVLGKFYLGLVKLLVDKLILEDLLDEATSIGIALVYVYDRKEFDYSFIAAKLLDKQNPSPEQIAEALENAKKHMHKFIRRGAVS